MESNNQAETSNEFKDLRRLNKQVLWLDISVPFVIFAVSLIMLMTQSSKPFSSSAFLFFVVTILILSIIIAGIAKLRYHFYKFQLTKEGYKQESGILSKSHLLIPYNEIQKVEMHRSILDRVFGLSNVEIYTAANDIEAEGGIFDKKGYGSLPGLGKNEAVRFTEEIMRLKNQ